MYGQKMVFLFYHMFRKQHSLIQEFVTELKKLAPLWSYVFSKSARFRLCRGTYRKSHGQKNAQKKMLIFRLFLATSWLNDLKNHRQIIIQFPRWAHLFLNSQRFPIYDATKLRPTSTFSGKCMGTLVKEQKIFT